ncbi:MAG TPA: AAA family ATPase [Solirubrobacteraceae bacterium]|nr:AAA family ATPase [Solirubrobacteraceae bacterium]
MATDETRAGALLGRTDDLTRLDGLAAGARSRRGAAIAIVGAPGVGKTALLRAVSPTRVRAIDVTAAESEVALPWTGLAALLEPLLGYETSLTPSARGALRGALALEQPTIADSARVLHAAVALLATAGADEPLLLRVDDVQWLDPSSRQAIAFIARRAADIGIVAIAVWSLRGEPFEPWPGVPVLTLGELGRADALALARRAEVTPAVAEALVDVVGGNPLALIEAPAQLSPDERNGRDALPAALPVGARLEIAYARRLEALPSATREGLLLAALSADGATAPLRAALGGLDVLAPAEDAGMIAVDARGLSFSHPIVRTAIARAAAPGARRAAHRVLAAAVRGPERPWHLAAAAQAPDEALAAELETLGYDAAQRGAPATAATALARAAELTPDRQRAIGRTVAASAMALTAGSPARAKALLDSVLADAREPVLRADVQLLRGMAIQQAGSPTAAFALLEAEAELAVAHDRARAAGLLTQAGVTLVAHGPMDRLAALAERALALAPPEAELVPAVLHASALATLGEHARARELLRRRRPELRSLDPTGPGHEILAAAALVHLWMEDYDDAERLLVWLIDTCRERGAIVALAFPLAVLASLHLRRGSLAEAARLSDEAAGLGEDAVGSFLHSVTLTTAAFVAANLGDAEACVRHAEEARAIALRLDLTSTLACAEQVLGFLALGAGDAATAIVHLERAREHTERFGSRDPSFLYTHADLVEAYVRAGRSDDAAALTDELAAGAAATGGTWAAAATARCRLLVEGDDRLDENLAAALAAHARLTQPFELARTRLCAGERLRRGRRRADARPQLAGAYATFAALGAEQWAARAAHELRATGGRRSERSPRDELLTARERDVCRLVAGGATNREVAVALYMSPRTVEHHLRMAYRKLGVRSRTEMTVQFAGEIDTAEGSPA